MHMFTLSCLLTLSMKNFQQFSLVSCSPAPFTSLRTIVTMFSTYMVNIEVEYTHFDKNGTMGRYQNSRDSWSVC